MPTKPHFFYSYNYTISIYNATQLTQSLHFYSFQLRFSLPHLRFQISFLFCSLYPNFSFQFFKTLPYYAIIIYINIYIPGYSISKMKSKSLHQYYKLYMRSIFLVSLRATTPLIRYTKFSFHFLFWFHIVFFLLSLCSPPLFGPLRGPMISLQKKNLIRSHEVTKNKFFFYSSISLWNFSIAPLFCAPFLIRPLRLSYTEFQYSKAIFHSLNVIPIRNFSIALSYREFQYSSYLYGISVQDSLIPRQLIQLNLYGISVQNCVLACNFQLTYTEFQYSSVVYGISVQQRPIRNFSIGKSYSAHSRIRFRNPILR